MARSAGSEKSRRRDEARHAVVRSEMRALRTAVKKVREASTPEEKQEAWKAAQSIIDVAGRKRIIHRNKAARMKSRLTPR